MTVLNVLSTNSVAAGATEYQTVQTGYYRVGSTAGAATVSFNGGAAITLVQNEFILIKGGKPGSAKIVKAYEAIDTIHMFLGRANETNVARDALDKLLLKSLQQKFSNWEEAWGAL